MVAQPIVLGLLVALTQYDASKPFPILFFAVVIALWLGLNNSARDLVRERRHYVRDRRTGLGPVAYLGAKTLVHALFGLGQILILLAALRIGCALVLAPHAVPALGRLTGPGLPAVLLLTYSGGVGLGLLVSVLVRTEEAAVAALPLLIMPQLLIERRRDGIPGRAILAGPPLPAARRELRESPGTGRARRGAGRAVAALPVPARRPGRRGPGRRRVRPLGVARGPVPPRDPAPGDLVAGVPGLRPCRTPLAPPDGSLSTGDPR